MQRNIIIVVVLGAAVAVGVMIGFRNGADAVYVPTDQGAPEVMKYLTPQQDTDTLVRYVNDPDPRVAARAVRVLASPKRPEAVPIVTKILKDPRPEVRSAAALAMSSFAAKDANVAEVVPLVTTDTSRDVRASAARTIGLLRVWEGVDELVAALRDPDPIVRRTAYSAIVRMFGRDYGYIPELPPSENAKALSRIEKEAPSFQQAGLNRPETTP